MPEDVQTYAARVAATAGPDGRLAIDPEGVVAWGVFPFEVEGLALKPGPALADVEAPRSGEDPATCRCADPDEGDEPGGWSTVWQDDDWQLRVAPPSGAPLVLSLVPHRHLDVADLPDELAASFGRVQVAVVRAVESLPSTARCHVLRWGDGGAHAHWWFLARPERMPELRGSFMSLWDDLLPPVPVAVRDENAAFVVERLVADLGGRAVRG